MKGRTYREILRDDAGYDEATLAKMTDEDCEAEYIEITTTDYR